MCRYRPPGEDEQREPRAGTARMNRSPTPVPEVAEVLERWRPANWTARDLDALEPLLPTVREWIAAVPPRDANQAARFLRASAGLAVWAERSLGTTDPTVALNPHNVEYWSMTVMADQSARWREKTRGTLRTLGRAINPHDWPGPAQKVGRQRIARPYTPTEQATFRLAAALPGRANRAKRMWIVAAGLGAGLYGTEIAAARTGDVETLEGGRLAIQVRGNNPRSVPIRNDYTNLARDAAEDSPTDRFFPTDVRNAVHSVAERLDPGDGQSLSLRRSRSTWLVAHMVTGTSLAGLRIIAGPVSMTTLDLLVRYAVTSIDNHTAIAGALRA